VFIKLYNQYLINIKPINIYISIMSNNQNEFDETRNEYKLTTPDFNDNFFYNQAQITYITKLPPQFPNHSREYKIIKPDTNIEFGNTISFRLKRNIDAIENLFIRFKLPDLFSQTIMTNIRNGILQYSNPNTERYEYLDGIGYYIFDRIYIRINGIIFYEFTPEILQIYHRQLSIHHNNDNTPYRCDCHGYFGHDAIYSSFQTTKLREYCVQLPIGEHLIPIGKLRNDTVEIVCNIKNLDDIIIRPFQREKECDMPSPYSQSISFINQITSATETYTTKTKENMLLESFELVASCLYLDIPLRHELVKADFQPECIFYQQFEEEFTAGNQSTVEMKIEPTGIARNLYIFIRLNQNTENRQYTNFSNNINTLTQSIEYQKCIKNISLSINRSQIFEAKQSDLLEIQDVENGNLSGRNNYSQSSERVLVIPLLSEELNLNGSIIWERFDDIRIRVNMSFPTSEGQKDFRMFVISENASQVRYYQYQADKVFN
jgi:hypothetical protein